MTYFESGDTDSMSNTLDKLLIMTNKLLIKDFYNSTTRI